MNILVLCTGNSARSIMMEAAINTLGQGKLHAFSAGSHPTGQINPFAIEQIATLGYPTETLYSKHWEHFASPDAPLMDFILTVCANAAKESCPFWPGHPTTAHWGFEDPAAVLGSEEEKRQAFATTFRQIIACVNRLVAVSPFEINSVREAIIQIGHLQNTGKIIP